MHGLAMSVISGGSLLSGAEYALVAQVPKAKDRWQQVHFSRAIADQFFGLHVGDTRLITLERVNAQGALIRRTSKSLVYSKRNKNYKLEFDFSPALSHDYPKHGQRPLLVVVNIDVRTFRYRTFMPKESGYTEMLALNLSEPPIGRGLRRIITTLEELELRYPSIGLRHLIEN